MDSANFDSFEAQIIKIVASLACSSVYFDVIFNFYFRIMKSFIYFGLLLGFPLAVFAQLAPTVALPRMIPLPGTTIEMAETEITVAQFAAFVEATNYRTYAEKTGRSFRWDGDRWLPMPGVTWRNDVTGSGPQPSNHPVIHISWYDAVAYCNWLSQLTQSAYRLPYVSEWEAAATGEAFLIATTDEPEATTERGVPESGFSDERGWNAANSGGATHAVATRTANGYGLHDMLGNVWEWTLDWFDLSHSYRELRGGSWSDDPNRCTVAMRGNNIAVLPSNIDGFRVLKDRSVSKQALFAYGLEVLPGSTQAFSNEGRGIALYRSIGQNASEMLLEQMAGKQPITLALVPGGSFLMGNVLQDSAAEMEEVHTATVPSFYMSTTEITLQQYLTFCIEVNNYYPVGFEKMTKINKEELVKMLADNFNIWRQTPVSGVSWQGANAYCEWLSKRTAKLYRLPTEAEWEFAAGGGNTGRTRFGNSSMIARPDDIYADFTSASETLPEYVLRPGRSQEEQSRQEIGPNYVQSSPPNALGLFEMSGNVSEWCLDTYGPYPASSEPGYAGPCCMGFFVHRGGSWRSLPQDTRVSSRHALKVTDLAQIGFRIVCFP